MKKYEFELSDELHKHALNIIREKYDLLRLFVGVLKFLINTPVNQNVNIKKDKKLILYIDKMSRVFFCLENKIFTFHFPFQIKTPENDNSLHISFHDYEIDAKITSLLLAIFNQKDIFVGTLDNVRDKILEEIIQNEWELNNEDVFFELIKYLMLFEPGYIRYDNDKKGSEGKGMLHPEHHLDLYFSSMCSFKLGLEAQITSSFMIDMLDTTTNCKYVKEHQI